MHVALISLVFGLGACAIPEEPGDELAEVEQGVDANNGKSLNGSTLNGTTLNGKSLNGKSLNGTSLNGKSLNGTAISASSTTAPPLAGTGVVGSTWTGTTNTGDAVNLRVDTAAQGTGANADLWFYRVSYQTTTGWSPLCGVDGANVPIEAVTVAGRWSATTVDSAYYNAPTTMFTFACRGKSIAKCVELGYKTYKGYSNQMQACVRLLRADFCGTGVSYTVDGTLLNLYDSVGVQPDTETWKLEAEWTIKGARCINSNNNARYKLALSADPKCTAPLQSSTCGNSFGTGAFLIDELP